MMNAVTQKDALEVASVFMNVPSVIGVDLVGSVAREGKGNDLDIVLTVNPFRYASFVLSLKDWDEYVAEEDEWEDRYFFGGYKSSRRKAALEIVALTPVLNAWLQCATRDFTVDLFLMPEGWRKHADEVQKHLPHRDPQFVRHIATDAVTLKRHKVGGIVRATR
jgi:hypothetical protein